MRKTTGSVGILKSDVSDNKPLATIDALMQGHLAGMAVTTTGGQPVVRWALRSVVRTWFN